MSSLRLHWQYQYELHQLLRQRLRSILLLIMGLLLLFSCSTICCLPNASLPCCPCVCWR